MVQVSALESGVGKLANAIACAHDVPDAAAAEIERQWERQPYLSAVEHASVRHIEGIGILRMTHRADTDNAKAWWQQINKESRDKFFSTAASPKHSAYNCLIILMFRR